MTRPGSRGRAVGRSAFAEGPRLVQPGQKLAHVAHELGLRGARLRDVPRDAEAEGVLIDARQIAPAASSVELSLACGERLTVASHGQNSRERQG